MIVKTSLVSKIIQITSCGHNNTPRTQSDGTLFALCEDGSLWAMPVEGGRWQTIDLPKIEETNELTNIKKVEKPFWDTISYEDCK